MAISSLSDMSSTPEDSGTSLKPGNLTPAKSGGGGGAYGGLDTVNAGAQELAGALGQIQSGLGGNAGGNPIGGSGATPDFLYKKGGAVKQKYTDKNGKLNLGSGRVSTAQKNKKNPNW